MRNKKPCTGVTIVYRPKVIDIIFYHDDGRKARHFIRPYYSHWLEKLIAIFTEGRGKYYSKEIFTWGWAVHRPDFIMGGLIWVMDNDLQPVEETLGWAELYSTVMWKRRPLRVE